jgi:hypothetical protein
MRIVMTLGSDFKTKLTIQGSTFIHRCKSMSEL